MFRRMIVLGAALIAAAPAVAQDRLNAVTNASGTIAAANTSQQAVAADPARRYVACQNPIAEIEPLLLNIDGPATVASGAWEIAPGGSWTPSPGAMPTGPVTVAAATVGHRFICKSGK